MIHRRESDRQALRRLLATERDSTLRQKASLEREFDSIVEASADVATDDEHDPEGTTIAFERAQVAALVERARARLTEFDDALERVDSGTYGICDRCGRTDPAGTARRPAHGTHVRGVRRDAGAPAVPPGLTRQSGGSPTGPREAETMNHATRGCEPQRPRRMLEHGGVLARKGALPWLFG
jgi:RNA polymerase-binding transcription factor DksA